MKWRWWAVLGWVTAVGLAAEELEPEAATGFEARGQAQGAEYMAATANPLATRAAAEILAKGGSAVDAAIAAQMVLTLTEPQSSGIGGGLFMLLWDAKAEQVLSLDGREVAPAKASPELFLDEKGQPLSWVESVVGGRAVGVPGAVAALYEAHLGYGKLPWSSLFDEAITLAEQGFEVSPRLAGLLAREFNPGLKRPGVAHDYFAPNGQWLRAGDTLTNSALALSLKRIAAQGPKGFYQGELAQQMVTAVQQDPDRPGLLTLEDLASYRPQWRQPLCSAYRRHQVCGMAPPSSGGVAIAQILTLLEPHDLSGISPTSADFTHLFSQASRIAYADRNRYAADPDFIPVPVRQMLDRDYLKGRGSALTAARDGGTALPGQFQQQRAPDSTEELSSTTHLVMADKAGNVVSLTSSIEMGFGSTVMVGGFLLNNQLTDFARDPGPANAPLANRVEAGKRPRSSMSPTLVLNPAGEPWLAIGSPGGSRIIGYVSQALVALMDFQLSPAEALALPRISHRNDYLMLESERTDPALPKAMEAMGYEVRQGALNSGIQLLMRTEQGWVGAADPRREGTAAGG
ncbi:gamma-glutamyltransferase [Ferrimonas marina]|uniref:Glutathione hydrolase proenzyme n=1 Tax=Ferrimonas marina TaxID=299255 RepID=A0A1M5SGP1_9GAMM|nr:gamma-glutamyltransferase [Ferrimonas marina]SHH37649.1 gamma-glutamyltranspeptidase / glutathione hydrolase [Ferrimonas marina]